MEYSAIEIATLLGGEVVGNPEVKVSNLSKIEEGKPQTLSFMANPKYEEYVYNTEASVVIVNKTFEPSRPVAATLIRVDDAYKAFATLLSAYNSKNSSQASGIHPSAVIAEDVVLGEGASVGPFVSIGKGVKIGKNVMLYSHVSIGDQVTIGDNCVLYSGVKVYQNCEIGSHANIHANAVIGSDGFGFTRNDDGSYTKIPQTGNVVIGNDVEIGANTTIDSATLGSTYIGHGVKLDNLVMVAHNCYIGDHTAIASMVGLAGSVKIGKRCIIAGQVGFSGHIEIADDVTIGPQAGVTKSYKVPGTILLGSPAYEVRETKRIFAVSRRLPDLAEKVSRLEKELAALKKSQSTEQ